MRNPSGRAIPVRHMVMDAKLQHIIDNLQPVDVVDDHIEYQNRLGRRPSY